MPRDSNGIYTLPGAYLATTGTTIEATQHNTALEDIREALTASLPRNGAAPMTGNLKMGSNKVTGLAVGTSDTDAATVGQVGALGQCRLTYVSTTQIKLTRFNGNKITINGETETIPSAGVTLANTSLTALTLYFVYAYMDADTMTLEASTTVFETNASIGMAVKTADSTRTLIAKVLLNASGQFEDSLTHRGVLSWFNRQKKSCGFSQSTAIASTTAAALKQFYALMWSDQVLTPLTAGAYSSAVAHTASMQHQLDATGSQTTGAYTQGSSGGYVGMAPASFFSAPAEGSAASAYLLTVYGWANTANTGTFVVTTTFDVWG